MLPVSPATPSRRRPAVGDVVRDLRADGFTTPLVVVEVGTSMATLQMQGTSPSPGTEGKAARYFDELAPWWPAKGDLVRHRGRVVEVMDDLHAGLVPVRPPGGGVEVFVRPSELDPLDGPPGCGGPPR